MHAFVCVSPCAWVCQGFYSSEWVIWIWTANWICSRGSEVDSFFFMLWAIFDAFEFTRKSTRWINWIAGKYTGGEMSCHRERGINCLFFPALFANTCFLLWLCFVAHCLYTSNILMKQKARFGTDEYDCVCVCVRVCVCVVSMGRCCHHRCVCHVKNTDGLHLFLSTTPLIILYITNALFTRVHLLQLILFIYLF